MKRWTVDPNSPATAEGMILSLAGMCNHAATHDGAGFSRTDVEFGHSLAQRAAANRPWTVKQASAAVDLIKKYHRQLDGKVNLQEWLDSPIFRNDPVPATGSIKDQGRRRTMGKHDADAVLEFAYDAGMVQVVKTRLAGEDSGRRFRPIWNPVAKNWTVPLNKTSIALITEFASEFGFEILPELAAFLADFHEKSSEDGFMLALNDNRNVALAMDKIVIVIDNPAIMEEFQRVLDHQ